MICISRFSYLVPAKFLSGPEYIDMLLMVEKGIRGVICHAVHQYAKAINKYMKDYDENKESSYLKYWDVNSLYGWAMLQKLSVNKFEWIEGTSQFNEDFIKKYNEESNEGSFLEVNIKYLEKLHELHNDLPFLIERIKIEKVKKVVTNLHDKTECYSHKKSKPNIKSWINFGRKFIE